MRGGWRWHEARRQGVLWGNAGSKGFYTNLGNLSADIGLIVGFGVSLEIEHGGLNKSTEVQKHGSVSLGENNDGFMASRLRMHYCRGLLTPALDSVAVRLKCNANCTMPGRID